MNENLDENETAHPQHRPTLQFGAAEREALQRLLSLSHPRSPHDYGTLSRLSLNLVEHERETGKQWDDQDTAELTALLAEYESLRQESMNTINNRTQILILGLAAMAALAGGSMTIDGLAQNRILVTAVFSAAIPLVCVFVLLVWLSEAMRSHRVGYFLASAVEARINAKLGRLALTWEGALWAGFLPRDELFGPSMMSLAVVGVFAAASPIFGLLLAGTPIVLQGDPLWELWAPYVFLLLVALYAHRQMPRLRNVSTLVSPMHGPPDARQGSHHSGAG